MTNEERVSAEEEIASEVLTLHKNSYGTGATQTYVHVVGDFVLVVLDVELTLSEQTLIDAGREDAVIGMREAFQRAVAPTFKAIIERATGRRVEDFTSQMKVDPVYAIEVFRLSPAG